MISSVEIHSQNDLVQLCKEKDFSDSILISIGNPSSFFRLKRIDEKIPRIIKTSFRHVLRLKFNDIDKVIKLNGSRKTRIPSKNDVEKAIAFYQKYKEKYEKLIIHCWSGISRSAAIGIAILYQIYLDEDKVIERLKEIRPQAMPNEIIIQYIDKIYNTNFNEKRVELLKSKMRHIKRSLKSLKTKV
jgi:predicted protein tyrosine phosphatase